MSERDRLVLMFGAMAYAAAVTQAVIERNWSALMLGAGALIVAWIAYRWMTR